MLVVGDGGGEVAGHQGGGAGRAHQGVGHLAGDPVETVGHDEELDGVERHGRGMIAGRGGRNVMEA